MEGGSHAEGEAAPLAEDDGGGGGGGDPGAARRKVARMKERRACIILGKGTRQTPPLVRSTLGHDRPDILYHGT